MCWLVDISLKVASLKVPTQPTSGCLFLYILLKRGRGRGHNLCLLLKSSVVESSVVENKVGACFSIYF